MEEKLEQLYKECLEELKKVGLDLENEKEYGKIDIKIAKRNAKRYGCCKQEAPDKSSEFWQNGKLQYGKFNIHHIEIRFIIYFTFSHMFSLNNFSWKFPKVNKTMVIFIFFKGRHRIREVISNIIFL